ncbi:MAG: hypothetical protein QOK81_07610, partial [Nitrososphaeraceae archaeon]|nr:hypothetical protein [Nitrososphaeraceae archaeon]
EFVMGDLAIATLANVTLYERDNATLIFETQYKTIEVHTTHTPTLKTLVIHSTTAVFTTKSERVSNNQKRWRHTGC